MWDVPEDLAALWPRDVGCRGRYAGSGFHAFQPRTPARAGECPLGTGTATRYDPPWSAAFRRAIIRR